ncbi:hypothetical protein HID58_003964 [Brassica napus]|uniref:Uncharacterized protein n=1 Tax=Brassica napus TaxID=3708 RepID=A0ABQ7XK50_BRANA|nr:hypothetical protein HID58_004040 [Brassica napus]KAH0855699.1 hypothetical protein HID58_003964 [Brassica napus]
MLLEHPTAKCKGQKKLQDLTIRHQPLPLRPHSYGAEEVVTIHDDMDCRIRHKPERKHRLLGSEPEEAHDHNHRVVIHMEEREALE